MIDAKVTRDHKAGETVFTIENEDGSRVEFRTKASSGAEALRQFNEWRNGR